MGRNAYSRARLARTVHPDTVDSAWAGKARLTWAFRWPGSRSFAFPGRFATISQARATQNASKSVVRSRKHAFGRPLGAPRGSGRVRPSAGGWFPLQRGREPRPAAGRAPSRHRTGARRSILTRRGAPAREPRIRARSHHVLVSNQRQRGQTAIAPGACSARRRKRSARALHMHELVQRSPTLRTG